MQPIARPDSQCVLLCDILWPEFSYILMTHATAPHSARTPTQAHPTTSCIHLVDEMSITGHRMLAWIDKRH